MMVPQSLAIIAASFPKETRGRAIGTWAAASALTTAIGPPLGGFLIDTLSWRAAFLINLPIGLIVLAVTALKVPESRSQAAGSVDLPGGALATIGLGALTVGLIYLPDRGLIDPVVLGGFVVAVIALPGFVIREARTARPMMPLALFRDGVFSRVNILTVLLYGALAGALFLVPYTLISVRGYNAAEAGVALLPLSIILGFFSRAAGALGDRIGTRIPMIIGPAIVALSFLALAVTEAGGSYWTGVFGPVLGLSVGMAIVVSPLTTTVMNAVSDQQTGVASGINNAAARVAGLLAVAVTGALSIAIFSGALRTDLPALALPPDAAAALLAGADRLVEAPVPASVPPGATAAVHALITEGYLVALRWALILNALLAAAAALVAWTLPAGKKKAES
jgi:MFS family permease